MTKLMEITRIVEFAKSKGFEVAACPIANPGYAELNAPEKSDSPGGVYNGCLYGNPDFVLSDDRPCTWPFKSDHPGLARANSHGVQKLLAHPLMADFAA